MYITKKWLIEMKYTAKDKPTKRELRSEGGGRRAEADDRRGSELVRVRRASPLSIIGGDSVARVWGGCPAIRHMRISTSNVAAPKITISGYMF